MRKRKKNQSTKDLFKPKKSWLILALASVFMLSPVGDIIISMMFYVPSSSWFSSETFVAFISGITPLLWIMLLINSFAGFALLFPRKWTWFGALVVLSVNVILNLRLLATSAVSPTLIGMTTFGAFGLAATLYFFRYPYLDRRDHILGRVKRHKISRQVTVKGYTGVVFAEDVSEAGARLLFAKTPNFKAKETIEFDLPPRLRGKVVYVDENACGVSFQKISKAARKAIEALIKETN